MARGPSERSSEEALYELLISLYDDNVDGLTRFIRFAEQGERVVLEIPGAGAPLSTVVGQIIASLKRHGLIDRVLFERLEAVFPRRAMDIRTTRDSWGLSPDPRRNTRTEAQDETSMGLHRKQLADAQQRKAALAQVGESTDAVDEEIKEMKRALRQGHMLRQGVELGRRYWLLNQIGVGGFGTVWRAHDRNTDTIVAIKVLHAQEAQDVSKRERFFRGARAMRKLDHPAIIKILDPECSDGDHPFFVMEYVEGNNLERTILEGKLPRSQIVPTIIEVGRALQLAHERKMIHRDVKPANIIIDGRGRPRLTDFDLVRAADTTGGTRQGGMGTFVYSAPEMYQDANTADERADIFGLGMTAVFAFLGRSLPLEVLRNEHEVFAKLGCSGAVKEALRTAIRWSPRDRYASMAEFCGALELAGKGRLWRSRGQKREMLALSVGAATLLTLILVVPALDTAKGGVVAEPDRPLEPTPVSNPVDHRPAEITDRSAFPVQVADPGAPTIGAVEPPDSASSTTTGFSSGDRIITTPTAPSKSLTSIGGTPTPAPTKRPSAGGSEGSPRVAKPSAPNGKRLTLTEQENILGECERRESNEACSSSKVRVRVTIDVGNAITGATVLSPYEKSELGKCIRERLLAGEGYVLTNANTTLLFECKDSE